MKNKIFFVGGIALTLVVVFVAFFPPVVAKVANRLTSYIRIDPLPVTVRRPPLAETYAISSDTLIFATLSENLRKGGESEFPFFLAAQNRGQAFRPLDDYERVAVIPIEWARSDDFLKYLFIHESSMSVDEIREQMKFFHDDSSQ